jgi:elongation factor P
MTLSYFDLRKGVIFLYQGVPHQVLEFSQMKKAQREGIGKTKIKNLVTGEVIFKNFHQNETFEEVELEKTKGKFIFEKQGKLHFLELDGKPKTFCLEREKVGESADFLKKGEIVDVIKWEGKIINVLLPQKVKLKVISTPPGVKGGREKPGTKTAVLETGVKIQVPLFVEEGDLIEVNTEERKYVKRIIE